MMTTAITTTSTMTNARMWIKIARAELVANRENAPNQMDRKQLIRQVTRTSTSFFQLAGHKECFKLGLRPDTILKMATGNEEECLAKISSDPELARFAPRVLGTVEQDGQTFLEMQDLLAGFNNASVMDVKMGYRTYREDELYKALRDSQLRHDMFDKMIEIDENEPTIEERKLRAVTKPRYMIWRESVSSTATLGFRIEGMRLGNGTIDKDFKTIKEEEQIAKAFMRYTKNLSTRWKYLHRLYDLKNALMRSRFFATHELIGTSLLFVHDENRVGVWLIDFAKTQALPNDAQINHLSKWELGNHEDGYLAGIINLIKVFESICMPSTTPNPQQQQQPQYAPLNARSNTTTSVASKKDGQNKSSPVKVTSPLKLEIKTS